MSSTKGSSRGASMDLTSSKRNSMLSNDDSLVAPMNSLSINSFAKRPGFGKLGKPVNALVNLFKINIDAMGDLFEYSVKIEGTGTSTREISARIKRRVLFILMDTDARFAVAATDYAAKIVSRKQLTPEKQIPYTYTVDYFEEEETGPRSGDRKLLFKIKLALVQVYQLDHLKAYQQNQTIVYPYFEQHIAALNILLARGPAQNRSMTNTARREKFFDISVDNGCKNLGNGLDVYKGYFRSARLTMSGLMVNLNTASSPMYSEGPLNKLITSMLDGLVFKTMDQRIAYLTSQLRLLRIETAYTGVPVRRTICEIAKAPNKTHPPISSNIAFVKKSQRITVADHFKLTYPRIARKEMNAPVINVGTRGRPIYIPSDLCHVLRGQPYKGFVPRPTQTAQMIKFACRPPAQNKELILQEGLRQMEAGISGGFEDRFKIRFLQQMTAITARLLPQPSLLHHSGRDPKAGTGAWNWAKKKFRKGAPPVAMKFSWFELLFRDMTSAPNLKEFLEGMQRAVREYTGNSTAEIRTIPGFEHSRKLPENFGLSHMKDVCNYMLNQGIRILFIILPDISAYNYYVVKTAADTACNGIHTVCTVRDKKTGMIKAADGVFANLMLKANPKLGGVNLTLQMPPECKTFHNKKIMFIGADVVHPGQNAMHMAPSVAAVVATFDEHFSTYAASFGLQQPEQRSKKAVEFIKDFGTLCESRLLLFRKMNQAYPSMIIVYRDGVADNMFAEVVSSELPQLQRACRRLYEEQKQPLPKITFIICQKRGQTRFYQGSDKNSPAFDQRGNPLPGFIVDSQITNGKVFDWFSVSHQCLQGTSRPTRYIVLHDESGATPDELQYLTHSMCFLWPRASKSISIHPAARAADVACDRARLYLRPVYNLPPEELGEDRPTYTLGQKDAWPGCIGKNLQDSMFYI